jgi:hypothetical protein
MNLQEAKQLLKENGYILEEGIVDNIKSRFLKNPEMVNVNLVAEVEDEDAKAWLAEITDTITETGFKIKSDGPDMFGDTQRLAIINPAGTKVGFIYTEVNADEPKYTASQEYFKTHGISRKPANTFIRIYWWYNFARDTRRVYTYYRNKAINKPASEVCKQWKEDLDFLNSWK